MRAPVGAGTGTAALAPLRRAQAQSFAISKNTCLSNGGGKVVGGRSHSYSTRFGKSCKPENQIIVTRERTSYGKPMASITSVASPALGPSDTNNT